MENTTKLGWSCRCGQINTLLLDTHCVRCSRKKSLLTVRAEQVDVGKLRRAVDKRLQSLPESVSRNIKAFNKKIIVKDEVVSSLNQLRKQREALQKISQICLSGEN